MASPKRSKWHSFITMVSIALLLVAIGAIKAGLDLMEGLRSADEYQDQGVKTFVATHVVALQEETHGTSSMRRRNPTHTVYYLEYRAQEHSGWRYRDKMGKSLGEQRIKDGATVQRRVMTIKDTNRYVTTEVDETPESFAHSEHSYAQILVGLGSAYIASYLTYLILKWYQRRRRPAV